MATVDEAFPRGGLQRKATPAKDKRSVLKDNLFVHQEDESKERKSKKRKRKKELKPQKSKKQRREKNGSVWAKQLIETGILSFKKLTVGTLLLGCVKEVTDFELVIGLPHGLTGYVSLTNVCDAYTKSLREQVNEELLEDLTALSDLYSPGMVVRCTVSELGKTKASHHSLKLSINPKDVNKALSPGALRAGMLLSGCVSSVEDHGYLVDIGVNATKAFLSQQKAQEYVKNRNRGLPLRVGQYLNSLLETVKNKGRVVQLSICPTDVVAAIAAEDQKWNLCNLLPGLVIRAEVQKVTFRGLVLLFLSGLSGSVDFMHLDPQKGRTYCQGQKVKACVLYVQPDSKSVHLTLRPHLLQPGAVLQKPSVHQVGEVLEESTVLCYHKGAGVTFQLKDGSFAYSRKRHLCDAKLTVTPSKFKEGTNHRCRVIDHSPMEQMALVSLKRSIIEAPFLSYQDIRPGQLIEGKVTFLEKFGMHVKLTDHIRGLVPQTHLADIPLKHPEKLYSVGDQVRCRVLTVNSDSKKLILTRKKTLVGSKLPIVTCYKEAVPRRVAHGYIVCVKPFGCIVRFYNEVRGLVPPQELSTRPVPFPEKVFYVGQVVKVTVLKCDPTQEKLLLSFKATRGAVAQEVATEAGGPTKESKAPSTYQTGKIVDVKVLSKTENGLEVSIVPEGVPAFLPTMHLSDHVTNCRLLAERLQEGDVISSVMCLSQTRGQIILCRKAAVLASAEQGPLAEDVSELQVGMHMPGLVKNIMPYGVFVEFPHGLVGLAPKAAMSDKFVTKTGDHFVVGQTVVAKVTNLDEEKKRVLLTLKVSECGSADADAESLALLSQYLKELEFIRTVMGSRDSPVITNLSRLTTGQRLELVVDGVKADGTVYFTGVQVAGLTVSASRYHQGEASVSPGQEWTAVVLFVDLLSSVVHVSLRQELLSADVKQFKGVSQHSAVVQFVAPDVAVGSLARTSQLVLIPVAAHLNDTFHFDSEKLSVGQTISVTLRTRGTEDRGIALAVRGPTKGRSAKRERRQSEGGEEALTGVKHALCIGDVVSGTVKSVRATCLLITLDGGVTGYVHASEILDEVPAGTVPTSRQKIGDVVRAKVIGGKEAKSHRFLPITHPHFAMTIPELTLRPSKLSGECAMVLQGEQLAERLKSFKLGQALTCYVFKYNSVKQCLDVEVTPDIRGKIELLLLSPNLKSLKQPAKEFRSGQALTATVIGPDTAETRLTLSLTGACSLDEGWVTLGTIKKVTPHVGVVIGLPFGKSGRAGLCDLADSYCDSPLEGLTLGRIVRCCVISKEENQLGVSLRNSRMNPGSASSVRDPEVASIGCLRKGQLLRGYIKAIGEPGVFISLSASVSGRVQYQHTTDYFVKDHELYLKHIPKGKLVTVKVLSVNKKQGHVELSLLPQHTKKPDLLPESLGLQPKESKELNEAQEELTEKTGKRKRGDSESEQLPSKKMKIRKKVKNCEESDSGVEVYCREGEGESDAGDKEQEQEQGPIEAELPRLQVSSGFAWDVSLNTISPTIKRPEEASSDSEEEESGDTKPKMNRREREAGKQQVEKDLAKVERQLMDPSRQPQTADDFDRLVLSSPDSSIVWMQYMAFHLHATEMEKARAVAERALKTISFREEQEKLNIWVALLNLENLYGTEESLMKVFERAVQYSEPLKVFQQLASVYTKSEKYKQADGLYNTMLKRFRQETAVWLSYATFLLKQGRADCTHALLQRALKCLPQKEHVDVIAKFAQLEFGLGDTERARAMFENTLSSYPKRTDLWSVYIDMMVKHGSQEEVRHLFERVVHLKLAPKKMKFFFKRYLEYEKKHGNAESVRAVKEKALEYVESKSLLVDS